MTTPIVETLRKPTFLSVAGFVFFAHLVLTFLLWLGSGDGELSGTAELAAKALLFPGYLLSPYIDFSSDALAFSCAIACWLLSAVLWSAVIAGLVMACQRLHTKSSNQALQPTAGRSDV